MDCKKDFPALQRSIHGFPLVYLDSAATTLKPTSVIEAVAHFDRTLGATVHRGVYTTVQEATALYQAARATVQHFIHAAAFEEVLFTRSTTSALNLLAQSLARSFCRSGDVILLSEIEHHSNLVPWQMVAAQYGLQLRFIPVNDAGELQLDNQFDERVKVVSIAHISNVLGTVHPIAEIIAKAHAVGALVCIDGAQSIAHLPIDVQQLDVDFFTFSGHKLYGPTGVGILYGKTALLEQMLPWEGGGDMIESVTLQGYTPNRLPYKFEAGTPMIAQAIGLGAAIDYVCAIGLPKIAAHEQALTTHALHQLQHLPNVRLIGTPHQRGAIISFVIRDFHPLDIATLLDCHGVAIRSGHHCSQPTMHRFGLTATCRLSFGLYNTPADIDQFIISLTHLTHEIAH